MKKLTLISTCIALGAAIVFEGSFLHLLLLMAAIFYLIVPASLIMGLWTAVAARRQTWRPWYSTFWRCAGIFTFCVLLSWLAGHGLHGWRVRQTRAYVSRAVAVLDDLHARTGQYPTTFPIDAVGTPPKWLRSSKSCTVSVQDFRFEYWDPAGMMGGYEFDSATRTWRYFD